MDSLGMNELKNEILHVIQDEDDAYHTYLALSDLAKELGNRRLQKKFEQFAFDELEHFNYLEKLLSIMRI